MNDLNPFNDKEIDDVLKRSKEDHMGFLRW